MGAVNLVASMIVKNELGRYLPQAIRSLREFCDLICVADDGSTDRTGEWLDDNTDEQLAVKHLNPISGFFAGHEGRRRQALLDFTMKHHPTYVLAIDADEFVADGQRVRDFCEKGGQLGTLVMQEIWGADEKHLLVRQDGGWREHPVPILWRADGFYSPLRMLDRALACGREPVEVRNRARLAKPTGTEIMHFGWANPDERQARYERYAVADGGKFHASRHLESIMWEDRRVRLTPRKWPDGLKEMVAL